MATRPTLRDFSFDGSLALDFFIKESPYDSIEQAVASLALFTHPDTVKQTQGQALFRIIRGPIPQRGEIVKHDDGKPVLLDDNTGPTDTFLWANGIHRVRNNDLQFCHIWQCSKDPSAYTSLANLCVLPAFLGKLSDTHIQIRNLLRRRALTLYGWRPSTMMVTHELGDESDELEWGPFLPSIPSVESVFRKEMLTKTKNRATISANQIGWLFSGWEPDGSLPA